MGNHLGRPCPKKSTSGLKGLFNRKGLADREKREKKRRTISEKADFVEQVLRCAVNFDATDNQTPEGKFKTFSRESTGVQQGTFATKDGQSFKDGDQ